MVKIYDLKEQCTGCAACQNICPVKAVEMVCDNEGFYYPVIRNEKCIDCGLCRKTCPENRHSNRTGARPDAVIGYSKDHNTVLTSSSGGLTRELAEQITGRGGVVAGAGYNKESGCVQHILIGERKGVFRISGTKYVQSTCQGIYEKIGKELKRGKEVLFFGTPCQTEGLKSYCRISNLNMDQLYFVDLICHGVASPGMFRKYIERLERNGEKAVNINFRDKSGKNSWRRPKAVAEMENGKKAEIKSFLHLYGSDYCLRPSCYQCPYADIYRNSDMTIGDFWAENGESLNEDGTSLILLNTKKGKALFERTEPSLVTKPIDLMNCLQTNLCKSTAMPLKRNRFFGDYKKKGYFYVYLKYVFLPVLSGKIYKILKRKKRV